MNEATPQLLKSLQNWDKKQNKLAQECEDMAIENNPKLKRKKTNIFYELSYSVLINTDDLYSLIVKIDIYCGGAHPLIYENAVIFNKKDGSKINPIDLYNITQKSSSGYDVIKPEIKGLIRTALLNGLDKDKNNCIGVIQKDNIDYLDEDTVGIGKKGLHIMYSGSYAVQSCYQTIVLPYQQLNHFLNLAVAKKLNWDWKKLTH